MPAVTFDVWHTLLYLSPSDEEKYYHAQVALATAALRDADRLPGGPELSDLELQRAFEWVLTEAVTEAGRGRTVTPAEQLVRAGAATGRFPRPQPYLERLAGVVARQPFQMSPGALELLAQLHEEGYRIGVIGNTVGEPGSAMHRVLAAMGFGPFVDAFVFSDEHPWAKPSPEIFWLALQMIGEIPERSVHVGDAWFDIEGARRAGFRSAILFTGLQDYGQHYRTFHLPSAHPDPPVDHTVRMLASVRELVHRILPTGASPS